MPSLYARACVRFLSLAGPASQQQRTIAVEPSTWPWALLQFRPLLVREIQLLSKRIALTLLFCLSCPDTRPLLSAVLPQHPSTSLLGSLGEIPDLKIEFAHVSWASKSFS